MSRWPLMTLWMAAGLASVKAQQPASEPKAFRGYGYAYFLTGADCCGFASTLGMGAGGDALIYRGLGASIDLGYVFPRQYLGCGIGLLSLNPSYHFINRSKPGKVMPFVTAGYGLAFRAGSANTWNYGGGLTWWLKPKTGLRLEVRDYRAPSGGYLVEVRTGIAFR